MKRTLDDIRENMDWVGCDNATALEMCDRISQLEADNAALMEVVRSVCVAMSNIGVNPAGQWTISNRSHGRISKSLSALPAHLKEEASK